LHFLGFLCGELIVIFFKPILLFSILANTISNGFTSSITTLEALLLMFGSCTFAFLLVLLAILSLIIEGLTMAGFGSASFLYLFFELTFLPWYLFIIGTILDTNLFSLFCCDCDSVMGLPTFCTASEDCPGTLTKSWH